MPIFATFRSAPSGARYDEDIQLSGLFKCFVRRNLYAAQSLSVHRVVMDAREALLSSWNTMSTPVTVDGRVYMPHFTLRAESGSPGGTEIEWAMRGYSDQMRERDVDRRVHHHVVRDGYNVIIAAERTGRRIGRGRTPPLYVASRPRPWDPTQPQPWSGLIVLGPEYDLGTIRHETGHVLGLGEGYRPRVEWRQAGSMQVPVYIGGDETTPGSEGTPMSVESGRDANRVQLEAIVRYAVAAVATAARPDAFGALVDGYRARRSS